MGHIKREFLAVAKGRSRDLYLQLETLSKFAVLGVVSPMEFEMVTAYLKDIGAKFKTKGKTLIWLEVLPESLQNLFLKTKNKRKCKN